MKKGLLLLSTFLLLHYSNHAQLKIDRKALVERHTIINTKFDSLSSLSVGNGQFAFTVDITGLQSFPDAYAKGVPLGTQSEWGWHSFTDTANYRFEETLKDYHFNGRDVSYSVQLKEPERKKNAVNWFRQNPHRLHLGSIGFEILKRDGSIASISDIKNIRQTLNMYNGEIHSAFTIEDVPVEVFTYCHQISDAIAVKVISALVQGKRLKIVLRYPVPTSDWKDAANNFSNNNKLNTTVVAQNGSNAVIKYSMDTTTYFTSVQWGSNIQLHKETNHSFYFSSISGNELSGAFLFSQQQQSTTPSFTQTQQSSKQLLEKFWKSGGAVDFTGSIDKRAFELERRIILSQYLTKIQCSGNYPPQETGLTYNSWYGRPHLEMHWWHGVHFALWGRKELLEKSMDWYKNVAQKAYKIAKRQGYDGLRWQKMTDNAGEEGPSSVGAFLIWQQPHFITFAELIYNQTNNTQTLNKYKDLVFATADFMASYAHYDTKLKRYILGKGVIAAQERFKAEETYNPTYELVYWYWALTTAQKWRERLHLPRNKKWDDVVEKLSPLPIQGDKYLFAEHPTDSYTNLEFRTDHPSVFGALGMLPKTKMVDTRLMKNTFDWIWNNWSWKETWGWDFPLTAMTATRLNMPDKAIDALLMPIQTNTYLNNGHNYQDDRLTIYLPGNGGVLTAIAMMCAGWEGNKIPNPGIPKDGKWKVKWEGLKKMF
jgi:protein-glucosylgalactosylhydroxylysine glucosidase